MVEMRAFLCLDFRGLIIPLENVCVIQRFKGDGRCFPESDKTADGGQPLHGFVSFCAIFVTLTLL